MEQITRPTLLVDKDICLKNIKRMAAKAATNHLVFRPHFKTHQSAEIGSWFRPLGVDSITVSSVQMAAYFAKNGWNNITLAFPFNVLEIENINQLASAIKLNVLLENEQGAGFLTKNILHEVGVYLKIDTGYNRTGIAYSDFSLIDQILKQLSESNKTVFKGFLTHTGHTYKARSKNEIISRHSDALSKLKSLKKNYQNLFPAIEISTGDTPSASVCDNFDGVSEIRPGNFVFYDLMQENIGACKIEDIAVRMACPVVSKHNLRNEMIIHGGAVHFSKEALIGADGSTIFGRIIIQKNGKRILLNKQNYLAKLSQEHGTLQVETKHFEDIQIGDIVEIIPVHSCLTANVMGWLQTTEGEIIEMMPKR